MHVEGGGRVLKEACRVTMVRHVRSRGLVISGVGSELQARRPRSN